MTFYELLNADVEICEYNCFSTSVLNLIRYRRSFFTRSNRNTEGTRKRIFHLPGELGCTVYQYDTPSSTTLDQQLSLENYRVHHFRLRLPQHFPQQVGINQQAESKKSATNPNQFKTRLKRLLVSKAFYLVEFMCP
ncbi:hypothetical protein J6590_092663 [Homalodisca vitripennis]|nr:hypothetical protein J6590_089411 [Homalodisca vitripennis]KAG8324419.1 hypothetical protein J6590_092663 [Homalodisca vitripennis]